MKAIAFASAVEDPLPRAAAAARTAESGRRPGLIGPSVFSPEDLTGRPLGGAKVSDGPALGVGAATETGPESEPGNASLKPIVEPAKTASSSQQTVRRGTR